MKSVVLGLLLVVLALSGCAHLYKTQIHDVVYLSDSQFDQVADGFGDVRVNGASGKPYVITQQHFQNLMAVRKKIAPVKGQYMQIALVDSDFHTLLLLSHDGKSYVAMSFDFLNIFGSDEESLAAALSHQYAHIAAGDNADVQDSREVKYFVTKEIVSTGVSLFATAAGGYGAGAAIDEAKRVQDKGIEDQVNPLGMKWLLDASYSPCGYLKIKYVMDKNSAVSSALTYLYTHPGINDRVKLSKQYLKENNLECSNLTPDPSEGVVNKSGRLQQ
ncbi:hypothetical protein ICN10_01815 [Polynucleobacter sp. 86C-FISCH]|uniref:hypothetical protein n=1 Tax=Polynucleobacter sp. 86C-FISCH TaxID=2689101 RepID=UPI001C0DF33D|nr:hypothetical protein [Polynucleobacter sp. 86C-FISCH]MBU3595134.1 hypothetical protein [Polynucleobacter sp. 86C-FISCH]